MTRAPQLLLDPLARRRNAAARLAGDDQHADAALRQRPLGPLLGGDLRQPERVGRRAADDGRRRRRRSSPGACWLDMPPPGTQCSAHLAAGLERRSRSRETARTRTGRTCGRPARRARRDTPPSSTRASTASSRSCRSSAAGGRSSTTSGSSACSARAARSAPCPRAGSRPDRRPARPSSSAAASSRSPGKRSASTPDAGRVELARVERDCGRGCARSSCDSRSPCRADSASRSRRSADRHRRRVTRRPAATSNRAAISGGNRRRPSSARPAAC